MYAGLSRKRRPPTEQKTRTVEEAVATLVTSLSVVTSLNAKRFELHSALCIQSFTLPPSEYVRACFPSTECPRSTRHYIDGILRHP